MNRFDLKQLITRSNKLRSEVKRLEKEMNESRTAYVNTKKKLEKIEEQLSKVSDNVIITEHALLQYMQRYLKIDVSKIKQNLLDKKTQTQIKTLGNGKYPTSNGHTIVVKNNVIVTVF